MIYLGRVNALHFFHETSQPEQIKFYDISSNYFKNLYSLIISDYNNLF